ncbi:MAG TPA: hypothetical protein VFS69_01470 [Sphingomicrobium sp.]|nr:hypothetical protein [Sphingomicrobium sp.]
MIDQMFDRAYQQGRSELNASLGLAISRVGKAMGNAFAVLNRIEYDAPWMARSRKMKRA